MKEALIIFLVAGLSACGSAEEDFRQVGAKAMEVGHKCATLGISIADCKKRVGYP